MHELPLLFALRRYRPGIEFEYPELKDYKDSCVLIQTSKSLTNSYSLTILDNVATILKKTKIIEFNEDKWLDNDIVEFKIKVGYEIIISHVKFNNYCIKFDEFMVPLFKMSEPHKILGDIYCDLHLDEYQRYRFNLFPIKNISIIPEHIAKVYIQSLIDKGECCPISLEPFKINNIFLTSCGHALSQLSADLWFAKNKTCPVCRDKCD